MSDRMLLASGVAFMIAAFVSFIGWRIWYHAPDKVRLRRHRKERALEILQSNPHADDEGS